MSSLVAKARKIVGREHVSDLPEDLLCYSYDASTLKGTPSLIAHPGSTREVAALMREAAAAGIPVVARGAGTGLSGGSVPVRGGFVLHFDRMNRIVRLDPRGMLAVVQPGVINNDLKKAASEAGMFYPPDPSSTRICTMGGNVAENAGGAYAGKYGVTGDYVLGLEAVLASGEVIRTGGESRRDVTGYDLTRLLVGSEGTLAIITEIILRLIPKPEGRLTSLIIFDSVRAAGEAVARMGPSGLAPAAMELIDNTAMSCVAEYWRGSFELPDAASVLLLLEVDGPAASLDSQQDKAIAICEAAGGKLVRRADTVKQTEEIWEMRRSVAPALNRQAADRIGEDISVPVGSIAGMLERIEQIATGHDLRIAVFGHAGDGNLHPNILTDRNDPAMMSRTEAAIEELFTACVDMGGTLSGEHGIGITKSQYINMALDPASRDLMRGIKRVFDPSGCINPGKIFPEESQAADES